MAPQAVAALGARQVAELCSSAGAGVRSEEAVGAPAAARAEATAMGQVVAVVAEVSVATGARSSRSHSQYIRQRCRQHSSS